MLGTATHDTKRGEDARTRIHVLSETPRTWRERVTEWAEINAACRSSVEGGDAPDRNDEYLFYQTLIGCWPTGAAEPVAPPEFVKRAREYMLKAIKEAKVHTSWIAPNEAYDRAVAKFVEESLTGERSREFLNRFLPFQRRIARSGMINSLAQLVLKLASPGVPDFYQGTALWDLSLVDPDNRQPVDYDTREKLSAEFTPYLEDSPAHSVEEVTTAVSGWLKRWEDGRIKLFVAARGLRLRRQFPEVFLEGEYIPLATTGEHADHVVAFARRHGSHVLMAAVPRLCVSLPEHRRSIPLGAVWGNTRVVLPPEMRAARFRNAFTQEEMQAEREGETDVLRVAELFRTLPVFVGVPPSGGSSF
jgi:(1->4)-alpha-D-glucan 1-alpha-D-glucosylmutase